MKVPYAGRVFDEKEKQKKIYGVVYITINLLNAKSYIGQTIYEDSFYLGSGVLLYKAIKKYRKENFKKKILCVCFSKKELNFAEKYLIKKYQTIKYGYNLANGGGGSAGYKWSEDQKVKVKGKNHSQFGQPKSENTKKKIGRKHKGRKHSKESKEKMSRAKKGKTAWNKGKSIDQTFSPEKCVELRRKNSQGHKGKSAWNKGISMRVETKKKLESTFFKHGSIPWNKDKHHTMQTIEKMSNRKWINNSMIDKKIKKENLQEYLDNGWVFGKVTGRRKKVNEKN